MARARANSSLQTLHERLIRPLNLGARKLLVLVLDGPLHKVPFSALTDESGRHLVESTAIVIVPSISAYLTSHPAAPNGPDGVVAISDPAFRSTDYPTLVRLPHAAAEGSAVRAAYANGVTLDGAAATPKAMIDALQTFKVIHYAGHAVVNEQFPELSRLVLAPASLEESGDLRFSQLTAIKAARTQVLGTCGV